MLCFDLTFPDESLAQVAIASLLAECDLTHGEVQSVRVFLVVRISAVSG